MVKKAPFAGPAREAALLFAICGVVALAGAPMPGPVHRVAVAAIGIGCFVLAGLIRVLPWGRWGEPATLVLIVPLLALVDLTELAGAPARTDTVLVFLLFAWVGAHQPRRSSLWLAPLAAIAYTVPMVVTGRATPFGFLSVLLMIVACMLVAELIAHIAEQRRASERELRFLADNTSDLVVRCSLDGVVLYASPSTERMLGVRPGDLVGRPAGAFCHPDDVVPSLTLEEHKPGEIVRVTRRLRRADGTYVWVEALTQLVPGAQPGTFETISSSRDITERRKAEEDLMHLATHDELTGLPNRFFLSQHLGPAFTGSAARGITGVVLFVDLDGFKAVNDSLGHAYGDRLLVQVAQRLERVTRAGDVVARFGGDEFIVACPTTDVPSNQLAERIEQELSVPFELDAHIVTISASVGWAHVSEGVTPEALMAAADRSMYAVKAEGRTAPGIFTRAVAAPPAGPASVTRAS
jgi:diguanylate cyclase (GGDEF)-like protein/PAS domain S-box-containing protein